MGSHCNGNNNFQTPFPGIYVFTGELCSKFGNTEFFDRSLKRYYGPEARSSCKIEIGGWLVAYGVMKNFSEHNYCNKPSGISVIFDGFLTDYPKPETRTKYYADIISELYKNRELSFINQLRGSFTCLIIDHYSKKAIFFNDRFSSRPAFNRIFNDNTACFAPIVKYLYLIDPMKSEVKKTSVAEFLLRGYFFGTDTIYSGIHKYGPAKVTELTSEKISSYYYWSLSFAGSENSDNQDDLIEKLDHYLLQAIKRYEKIGTNSLIFLTGGFDSRLMLAYLLKEKTNKLHAISYYVEDTPGNDHLLGKNIADHFHLEHELYERTVDDYVKYAIREVFASDGLIQMVDTPTAMWDYIQGNYDTLYIGDKYFGFKQSVNNIEEARDTAGLFNLKSCPRISDWIHKDILKDINDGLDDIFNDWLSRMTSTRPNNIKDTLYYYERLCNLIIGYGYRKLCVIENLRPLLDEDIIDFIATLGEKWRCDKLLAKKLMEHKYNDYYKLPFSMKKNNSIPWNPPQFRKITKKNAQLKDFIIENTIENMNTGLSDIFDVKYLKKILVLLFNDEKLPPLKREWWVNFPGMWRFSRTAKDHTGVVQGALRLLNLNIYLNN